MDLKKEDIEHIAKLARLDLSEEEKKNYQDQLSAVFEYIDQLQEVNTDKVEPTAQVSGLENALREDKVKGVGEEVINNSLQQAPEIEDNQIKVKRVLK